MKILFVSTFFLFENTRYGGPKRLYYLVRELAKTNEIDCIFFDSCNEKPDSVTEQPEFGRLLDLEHAFPSKLEKLVRLHIDIRPSLRSQKQKVEKFIEGRIYHAIILAFPFGLSFLDCGFIRNENSRVFYLEDDLVLGKHVTRLDEARSPLSVAWHWYRLWMIQRYYRNRLRNVDGFIVINEQERETVERFIPNISTPIISYGIPLEEYPFLPYQVNESCSFGFIGNYGHRPNRLSIEWFLAEMIGPLKCAIPNASVVIGGKNIPDELRAQYAKETIVSWMENVPDLTDFYRQIDIFINPINFGRGLRTKLVEAAAYGKPIVSTPLGAEGLECFRIEIASTVEEFIQKCSLLANNNNHYNEIAMHNREIVEKEFSLEQVKNKLEEVLQGQSNS